MRRSEQKEKYIIYTAAILLCLVMASFWLMSNIYARYTAQASGGDSARVAKFNVTESGEATSRIKTDIWPGETKTYSVDVTNKSEVAIDYTITAKNTYKNLPLKIQILNKDNQEVSSQDTEISATDHTAHTYKVEISWPKTTTENNSITDPQSPEYSGKTDVIEITLNAVQKD